MPVLVAKSHRVGEGEGSTINVDGTTVPVGAIRRILFLVFH